MEIEAVTVHPWRSVVRWFQQMQDQPVVWYTLAALVAVAQIGDTLLTALALLAGGGEANPLGRALFAHGALPLVGAVKLLLALALMGLLVAFARTPAARRSVWGYVALGAAALCTLAYYLILGNNVGVLLVAAHALPWMR